MQWSGACQVAYSPEGERGSSRSLNAGPGVQAIGTVRAFGLVACCFWTRRNREKELRSGFQLLAPGAWRNAELLLERAIECSFRIESYGIGDVGGVLPAFPQQVGGHVH